MMRAAVVGCAGRMGYALVRAVAGAEDMTLVGAVEAPDSGAVGQDAGTLAGLPPLGVAVSHEARCAAAGADGVIDFSSAAIVEQVAAGCVEHKCPLVVGTTGLDESQHQALEHAAQSVVVVFAPNMSVGVNVLFSLVAQAARLLGPGYEAEVVEAHHHHKRDAPSGTARRIVEILAQAAQEQGLSLEERTCHGRQGDLGPRPASQIGVHAIRGGDIVGEHTVMLCGTGERVELTHRATSRQTFAQGALRALRWARVQPAGLYDMQDVLGLRT